MVIVEFFDQTPIKNMVSTLANAPERVVFVGEMSRMKKQEAAFQRFLSAIGNTTTELEYRGVKVHALHEIVAVLESVVQDYPGCCFDLAGGDDLTMVAIGVVYERYRAQGVELHQYNIRNGNIYDCDLNGKTASGIIPNLTVEQNIILHGGCIVSSAQRESGTYDWNFDEEFTRDIQVMWDICRTNPGGWNHQITMLDEMQQFSSYSADGLHFSVDIPQVTGYFKKRRLSMNLKGIFYALEKEKLISGLENKGDRFRLVFKNGQIKRCLTKAGTILELRTYLIAHTLTEADGSPRYHDVMTGVFIDWDGTVHDQKETAVDTENEIDLILMRGLVPVFVSCKNGAVEEGELYKLNTVANRFGGAYARKLLIGTTLGKSGRGKQYFLERAKDMQIQVLDNVHELSDKQFVKALKAKA